MKKLVDQEEVLEIIDDISEIRGTTYIEIVGRVEKLEAIEISEDAISREWALNEFKKDYDDIYDLMQAIENAPSVVPSRPKGEWRTTDAYPHRVFCSECYKTFAQSHWEVWEDGSLPRSFCPNCGADMRGNKE